MSLYHLEDDDQKIVLVALEQLVARLGSTKIVDIPLDRVVRFKEEYNAAKNMLKDMREHNVDSHYHSLLLMRGDRWEIDFGDFDMDVVISESSQYDDDHDVPYIIITTSPDQDSINDEVHRMNKRVEEVKELGDA